MEDGAMSTDYDVKHSRLPDEEWDEWDETDEEDEEGDMYLDPAFSSWDDFYRYMYG